MRSVTSCIEMKLFEMKWLMGIQDFVDKIRAKYLPNTFEKEIPRR